MSNALVLHSFAELADYFPVGEPPAPAPAAEANAAEAAPSATARTTNAAEPAGSPLDLGALLAQIAAAGATVAGLRQQDQEARRAAQPLLARYDALQRERQAAEQAWNDAQQVRQATECLAAEALAESARTAAGRLLPSTRQAETAAAGLVEQRRAACAALAADPLLSHLLEERRREEERHAAEAAAAERTRQVGTSLAAVHAALAAGRLQEALALVGPLARDYPGSADVASVHGIIRQRCAAVKIDAAEEALRAARRSYRHAPADAIARLEAVDLQELPEQLLQQLKGVWAAACARLCKERQAAAFLRYLPQPAYGVVIAQEAAGAYRVISALGACHFQAGAPVDAAFVRRAQPLRARGR